MEQNDNRCNGKALINILRSLPTMMVCREISIRTLIIAFYLFRKRSVRKETVGYSGHGMKVGATLFVREVL